MRNPLFPSKAVSVTFYQGVNKEHGANQTGGRFSWRVNGGSWNDQNVTLELSRQPQGLPRGHQLGSLERAIPRTRHPLIFGSLGTPLITQGQDWMRSKHGIRNTYNQGDELNALRWGDRERPHAREVSTYYADIIRFRLSEAGRALRVAQAPSMETVWTGYGLPDSPRVIGGRMQTIRVPPQTALLYRNGF